MKVSSHGIINGIIDPKYGKHGTHFNINGMSTYSLPLEITEAPKGTISYAIVIEDKDAFPICGFSWIHWTVANLTKTRLEENESQNAEDFLQGVNSWISPLRNSQSKELSSHYCGMGPPDKPHVYEIHVYALDCLLELENGFMYNELYKKMEGHILETCTIKGEYNNIK